MNRKGEVLNITLRGAPEGNREMAGQYSEEFLQGMVNRVLTSYHKYGSTKANFEAGVDFVDSLKRRLAKYEETGNTEWLMDVANYAMIEFMHPHHPDAHYRATDYKETPGRRLHSGKEVGQKHELDINS
jgi:hypothetical protein